MHQELPEPGKSARPTWAPAGAVGLADWEVHRANSGQAVETVGLADLEQAGVGLADFKVGLANSEQADNPSLLFVGA
jgi:hypothetical protein